MGTHYLDRGRLIASLHYTSIGLGVLEGTNFVTENNHSLQVGVLHRKAGTLIEPHQHLPTQKVVTGCQEIIIVLEGLMRVVIYSPEGRILNECDLHPGTIFIQYMGGHSFDITHNARFIEVKQGPYVADDKIYFNPLAHEQTR